MVAEPAQGTGPQIERTGEGGWVLRAPRGTARLDGELSEEQARRVLQILLDLPAAQEVPAPAQDTSPATGVWVDPDDLAAEAAGPVVGGTLDTSPATGVWVDPDDLAAQEAGSPATGVWVDPDDLATEPGSPEQEAEEPGDDEEAPASRPARHRARHTASPATGPQATPQASPALAGPGAVAAPPGAQPPAVPGSQQIALPQAGPARRPGVTGLLCAAGHLNPPDLGRCLRCPAPLLPGPVTGPRPTLATLLVSTGESVPVNGPVVVGRAPRPQEESEPSLLVTVPSPTHVVSRSHLALTTTGWSVLARDLGSNNGTVLLRPGSPPVLIATSMPTPLLVGDLLDVGDGVTLRLAPPA